MSADIWIESAECCSAHDHNVTHNLAPMFRAVGLDWHDFYEHDGNGGKAAADMLPSAVMAYRALRDNPEDYEHLNPPNGWGDLRVAVEFLDGLIGDLARHPEGIVRVSL
jgi:hypothetical protein